MIEKLEGKVLDGRWQFKTKASSSYVFENIYNHREIKLSYNQVNNILEGKDTISHIQTRRIGTLGNKGRKDNPNWWQNSVCKQYAKNIQKNK